MSFARPELLALTALAPLAGLAAAVLWRRRIAAAEAWAARGLWDRLLAGYSPARLGLSVTALVLAVLAAGLALAQPRWGETLERVEREGVDVVLVLDASLSMGATDVQPSRLEVAEALLRRLAQGLAGHRLGLVGAEGTGVVLAPLTTDAALIDLLLDGVEPGSLAVPGTRLGDALERIPDLFPEGTERHRTAVLVSDGEDHGGGLDERIDRLVRAGVVVHALGVATPQGAPVPIPGQPGEVRRHRDGSVVISRLGEEALESIARGTGGVYLRATDPGRSLRPILAAIEGMERRSHGTAEIETGAERFQWPLAAAVAALLVHLAVPPFRPAAPEVGPPAKEGRP